MKPIIFNYYIADRKYGGTGIHVTYFIFRVAQAFTTQFIYMHHDSWYIATDPDCFKLVLVLVEISYFPLFNDNGSGWL